MKKLLGAKSYWLCWSSFSWIRARIAWALILEKIKRVNSRGSTSVEYVILAACIGAFIVVVLGCFGISLNDLFLKMANLIPKR